MVSKDLSAIGAGIPSISYTEEQRGKEEEDVLEEGRKAVQREVHYIALIALRIGAALLALTIIIRLWHLLGPEKCRWLSISNIQEVDKMLFSSVFGGMVLGYFREIMKPIKK